MSNVYKGTLDALNDSELELSLNSILTQLDITLSSLRDAICDSGIDATTLKDVKDAIDALETLSVEVTKWGGTTVTGRDISLDFAKIPDQTASGNAKVSIEEAGIQLPTDIQSQYKPLLDSTTTPLGGSVTYTGSSVDVSRYARVTGMVYADQACTLYVDISADGANWDYSYSEAVSATTGLIISVDAPVPYVRLRIVNGVAAQATLRAYLYGRVI